MYEMSNTETQYAMRAMEKRRLAGIAVGSYIASGGFKDVHEHPENPNLVRCVFRGDVPETVEYIEGRYCLTRLLHKLYPDQIPDMVAYSVPQEFLGEYYVDMQKVHTDKSRQGLVNNKLPERATIIQNLKDLGVGLDTGNYGNFSFDTNGKLWYVDSIDPWGNRGLPELTRNYNPRILLDRMQELPETERETTVEYLRRLEKLFNTEFEANKGRQEK